MWTRAGIAAGLLIVAFGVGWLSNGWRWEAKLATLTSDYNEKLAQGKTDAKTALDAEIKKAQETDRDYQTRLAQIQADADARPPRIIRVRCPAAVPAAGDRQARDPGQPDAAATDRSGVGPNAGPGILDLDASGLVRITDEAKRVSARLRALQGVCR